MKLIEYPEFIRAHRTAFRRAHRALTRAVDAAYRGGRPSLARRKAILAQFRALDALVRGLPPVGAIMRLPALRRAFVAWARRRRVEKKPARGERDWVAQELGSELFTLHLYIETICEAFEEEAKASRDQKRRRPSRRRRRAT